jgi:hypothetical protein
MLLSIHGSARRLPFVLSIVLVGIGCGASSAAPPVVTNITPRGAERGKAGDILVTGTGLSPQARLVLPFKATQRRLTDVKSNPLLARFQVTVDPSVPLGSYRLRVVSEEGVSGFVLFRVDSFPTVAEVESNDTFDKAQKVPFPVVVDGQCAGGDIDFFRFSVKKGQRVVVETEAARLGSALMPQIRVTSSAQGFVASDDSQKLRGDCRVIFTAAADGDFVVEISDSRYRGGTPSFYRLRIGDYDVVEEVFPLGGKRGETVSFTLRGGTLAKPLTVRQALPVGPADVASLNLEGVARIGGLFPRLAVGDFPERVRIQAGNKDPKIMDVTPPVTINGRLTRAGDIDRFQFPVQAGQQFRLSVQADALGSQLDGVLRITDQTGTQLALVDDVALPAVASQPALVDVDPAADVTVPAGATMLFVELRDQRHRGGVNFGYRLTIEPTVPDFVVHQMVSELNVPRGGTASLTVPVTRRGYIGAIGLTVAGLPAGWTVQGGYVPAGKTFGVLTISAPLTAPPDVLYFSFLGKAVGTTAQIARVGSRKHILTADPSALPQVVTLKRFAVGVSGAQPFVVKGPATLELVKGYPATVPIGVTRALGQAALAVEVSGVTPGKQAAAAVATLSFKPAVAAANATSASFTVTAALTAAEGRSVDLLIQGKATINSVDRVIVGPPIAVTVVRPFVVEVPSSSLALVPGQTVPFKVRLKRHAMFKEAVQIVLTGLPNGVTLAAPLKPIAPNQMETQIDLRVDPKTAAGMASLTVTCSAAIAGMAYSHPPVTLVARVGK